MSSKQPAGRPGKPRRDHPRGPGRSANQRTVKTEARQRGSLSVGGLTISMRALASFLVAGLVVLVLIPTGLQWSEQRREYRAIVAEVAAANDDIERLQQDLDNWSDDDYVASQARSRLGYVKKGETQFSVVDAPVTQRAVAAAEKKSAELDKPWTMNLETSLQELDNPPATAQSGE